MESNERPRDYEPEFNLRHHEGETFKLCYKPILDTQPAFINSEKYAHLSGTTRQPLVDSLNQFSGHQRFAFNPPGHFLFNIEAPPMPPEHLPDTQHWRFDDNRY